MKKYFILVLLFISCLAKKENNKLTYNPNKLNTIVSLSPSITEEVFALGLGNRLVGVTNYCKYPKKAIKIPKIGGFSFSSVPRPRAPFRRFRRPLRRFFLPPQGVPCARPPHRPRHIRPLYQASPPAYELRSLGAVGESFVEHHSCSDQVPGKSDG